MEIIKKSKSIILLLFFFASLYAAQGDAGREIALLEIGYGARAFGLGSAYVAHQPDATSLHWNPAALGFLKTRELATMQNKLSSDADYYYLGSAFPTRIANWGISWVQIEMEEIPETAATLNNNEVDLLGNLTYHANAITLGAGRQLTKKLSLGISAKYISKVISDDYGEGTGYTSSAGLMYLISDRASFGFTADNISNQQTYDTKTTETVPAKHTAGFLFALTPKTNLLAASEKRADQDSLYKGHYGLEFVFNENMHFLIGYDYDKFTAGAGFSIQGIYVDYAYIAENSYNLGAEHFVTVGVKW